MRDYAKMYSAEHDDPKALPGFTVRRYAPKIKALVDRFKPRNLLDYGSGKGYQYLVRRIHEKWGGMLPFCYDIGVRLLSERPAGKFDGVICVDMLEHIARDDVREVLRDVLGYAEKFAFLGIACKPSNGSFPDGTNYHLTIEPPEWWEEQIRATAPAGLCVERAYDCDPGDGSKQIRYFS